MSIVNNMQLTLTTSGGCQSICDFKRFRYMGVPKSKNLSTEKAIYRFEGFEFAEKLYDMLLKQVDWSESTKHSYYVSFVKYVAYCDKSVLEPCSKQGLLAWYTYVNNKLILGKWKNSTCIYYVNSVKNIMRSLGLPVNEWLMNQFEFENTQSEPVQAYSDNDIKKLLYLLFTMFNQLYSQFIVKPQCYINKALVSKKFIIDKDSKMYFNYNGNIVEVHYSINKLACLSCYLMAYYTWGNTTQLLNIKRPILDGKTLEEMWVKMPVYKRRANKNISIELGDNDNINIPRHAVKIVTKILHISNLLNPDPESLLLLRVNSGKVQKINVDTLSYFNSWLKRKFDLRDDFNRPLIPLISRFRATGSSRFQVYTGEPLKPTIVLGNTPQVVARHYSTGNKHDNDLQNQASSCTMEFSARRRKGIDDAKQATKDYMNVKILPYEAYLSQNLPPSRNVNGSYCGQPFGERAARQSLKAFQRNILKQGERLACADLLKCFDCPDQVIVESVDEFWCILSFRECIEESVYLHLDRNHFKKNFEQKLLNIDCRLAQVDQKKLHLAALKLNELGRHPQWLGLENISVTLEKAVEK